MQPKEKTWVYIDALNLYYGALRTKPTGLKWLNYKQWLDTVLYDKEVLRIKLFTAKIAGNYNPHEPQRQENYFRALRLLERVEIIEGKFLFPRKRIRLTADVDILAKVPEEKGTDVNLAVHLVNDAHNGRFDTAVVVSNDSDLAEAVRVVTREIGLKVGILNPYPTFSKELSRYATFKMPVRETALLKSQFPNMLTDKTGQFFKPHSW